MRLVIAFLIPAFLSAATLVSRATGNFTTSTTWGVAENAQLTRSANTNTTTSYVYSSQFTCTNLNVVARIVFYGRRLNTTGTVSFAISDDGGTTATREVTVNASDIDDDDTLVPIKLGSTLTCDGGTDYAVGIKASDAANATFYRDGTAGNWFRVVTRDADTTPGAADVIYVVGERTGAGAGSAFTVTMNETAATVYGATTATESIGIGQGGTLSYGVAASTNYDLNVAGIVRITGGGTFNIGTGAGAMPSTSTAFLDFDLTANGDSGVRVENGGTLVTQGATKVLKCELTADEAAAQTVIGPLAAIVGGGDCTTGWLANDEVGFASTTRTYTQAERKTISTVDSATQVTLTAGLTNAHSGTSPARGEVIMLTQNVRIRGESTAPLHAFIYAAATGSLTMRYTQTQHIGVNAVDKMGIVCDTTSSGVCNIQSCSLIDHEPGTNVIAWGYNVGASSVVATFSNNVVYNSPFGHFFQAIGGSTLTVTDNVYILLTSFGAVVDDADGLTFTGNIIASSASYGLWWRTTDRGVSLSDIEIHSGATHGWYLGAVTKAQTITNPTIWRNTGHGIYIDVAQYSLTITGYNGFGNDSTNLNLAANTHLIRPVFTGWTVSGDSTFGTQFGAHFAGTPSYVVDGILSNSTFGVASGIRVAHSTNDIALSNNSYVSLAGSNVTFASTTPFGTFPASTINLGAYIGTNNYGQVDGDHRRTVSEGSIRSDTTTFNTASPSERITPNISGSYPSGTKIRSGIFEVAINDATAVTFSVYVRKSVAGDSCGAEYNGAQPRLIVLANPGIGITADTVLDTMTVAVGNWEQIGAVATVTATDNGIVQFVVDGDGTSGCFYVDDPTATGAATVGGVKHWINGLPGSAGTGGAAGGGSFTFVTQ